MAEEIEKKFIVTRLPSEREVTHLNFLKNRYLLQFDDVEALLGRL